MFTNVLWFLVALYFIGIFTLAVIVYASHVSGDKESLSIKPNLYNFPAFIIAGLTYRYNRYINTKELRKIEYNAQCFMLVDSTILAVKMIGQGGHTDKPRHRYQVDTIAIYNENTEQWELGTGGATSRTISINPFTDSLTNVLQCSYLHDNLRVMLHNLNIKDGYNVAVLFLCLACNNVSYTTITDYNSKTITVMYP